SMACPPLRLPSGIISPVRRQLPPVLTVSSIATKQSARWNACSYASEDTVVLQDVAVPGKTPYFASDGYLVDFSGKKLPGSQILAALPVDLAHLGDTFMWPPQQSPPFGELPLDA